MPDNSDNLGDLTVNITGDLSELQAAIDQSVSVANDGGQQIAAALQTIGDASGLAGRDLEILQGIIKQDVDSGVTLAQSLEDIAASAGSLGDQIAGGATAALEQLQTAEQGAGDAAAQASGQMDELASSTGHAAETAAEGETVFSEFGETLLELSGIAIGAEALKEFATEALETYANVEKATIALGAMTGSGEKATEAIEALKSQALGDALSFPTLVTAYQRMTAFGFAAEQIPATLQAAADAAAATGKSFDAVSNAIDRMALSGTAGKRQLATIGISLDALGVALNTTGDKAAEAFKELDPTDRLVVIDEALQKWQGTAQAVAQGVAGQWQNLKTQTEFVFESIGQAIAPAAEAIMGFASKAVLPAAQIVANAYAAMGTAEQDFIGTLSTAGASLLDADAKTNQLGSSTQDMGALVKQTAQDSFVDSFTPGVRAATAALEGFSLGIQVVTSTTPGADQMLQLMTTHLDQMATAAKMGGEAFSQAFALSVRQATGSMQEFSSGVTFVVDSVDKLNKDISDGKQVLADLKSASDGSAASLQAIAFQSASVEKAQKALATALGESTKAAKDQKDSWEALETTVNNEATAMTNAQETYDALSSAFNSGKDSINGIAVNVKTLADAWNNLAAAQLKATGIMPQWTADAANVSTIVQNQANQFTKLQNAVDQTDAAFKAQQDAYNAALAAGTATDKQLQLLQIAYNDNQKAIGALSKAVDTTGVSMADLTGKASEAATVLVNGQAVAIGASTAIEGLAAASQTAGVNQQAFTGFVADGTSKIGDLVITTNASAVALGGEAAAADKSTVAVGANAAVTKDSAAAKTAAANAAIVLANKLQLEDQAWADGLIVMQNYAGVLVKETSAATDAVDANANLSDAVKQMASDMVSAGEQTNSEADALLALAAAADDAADAVDHLNTSNSKTKGSGSAGVGAGLAQTLAQDMAIESSAALGGALGGGGINQSQIDAQAQALANATGEAVTTLDGYFVPAVAASTTATTTHTAATTSNTAAVTSNTTATVAATAVLTAAQTSFIDSATAGDAIVTSFASLPPAVQDFLNSVSGTLVAYDDTTGALQYTEVAANGLTETLNSAVSANELTAAASTRVATAVASVAQASTGATESISTLGTIAAAVSQTISTAATTLVSSVSGAAFTIGQLFSATANGGGGAAATGPGGAFSFNPGGYVNPNPDLKAGYAPSTGTSGVTLIQTISGNFVASDQSIRDLGMKAASAAITALRNQGGLKN